MQFSICLFENSVLFGVISKTRIFEHFNTAEPEFKSKNKIRYFFNQNAQFLSICA